ncbi:MAG: hypothetical protein RL326_2107, partial [Pseudomonadota bacterium]
MRFVSSRRVVSVIAIVTCVGCAIPRDHHTFSVYVPGNERNPFL